MPRLTKRFIDTIATPDTGRDVIIWDDELSGFGLRVRASGARTYVAVYRIGDRKRWFTIGCPGAPWTPETARQRAAEVLLDARSGGDPQADKVGARIKTPTVNQLIDAYLLEGPADKPNKRVSSWVQDRSSLHHHVRPLIGTRRASELAASDIARLQADIAAGKTRMQTKTRRRGVARVVGGKATAARTIVIFQAMCAWAVTRGYLTENPAKGVKRYKIEKRERYFSEKELRVLWDAVDLLVARRQIPASHAAIFRLLALTGARKTEITALSWREVDFVRGRIVLAAERSKTGAKQISLSDAALTELRTLHACAETAGAAGSADYVFPALRGGVGPTVDVQSSWEKVRRAAELPDVRMHDLRHTFASIAVADGVSLFLVGKALGHTQTRTTERYAHLSDSPIRKVANQVSERVQASFPIAQSNDDAA